MNIHANCATILEYIIMYDRRIEIVNEYINSPIGKLGLGLEWNKHELDLCIRCKKRWIERYNKLITEIKPLQFN